MQTEMQTLGRCYSISGMQSRYLAHVLFFYSYHISLLIYVYIVACEISRATTFMLSNMIEGVIQFFQLAIALLERLRWLLEFLQSHGLLPTWRSVSQRL